MYIGTPTNATITLNMLAAHDITRDLHVVRALLSWPAAAGVPGASCPWPQFLAWARCPCHVCRGSHFCRRLLAAHDITRDLHVVKVYSLPPDSLVGLMALAGYQHDVAPLCHCQPPGDRRPPVRLDFAP